MGDNERSEAVVTHAKNGLPAGRMTPAWTDRAETTAASIFDHRPRKAVDILGAKNDSPLFVIQAVDVTGETHAAQKCRAERIGEPLQTVSLAQDGPDLALLRQEEAMVVGGGDGIFHSFVGVGKIGHRRACEEGGFETMLAGGAAFNH